MTVEIGGRSQTLGYARAVYRWAVRWLSSFGGTSPQNVIPKVPPVWTSGADRAVLRMARSTSGGVMASATGTLGYVDSLIGSYQVSSTGRVYTERWIAARPINSLDALHLLVCEPQCKRDRDEHANILLVGAGQLPREITSQAPDIVDALAEGNIELAFCSFLRFDGRPADSFMASSNTETRFMFLSIWSASGRRTVPEIIQQIRALLPSA